MSNTDKFKNIEQGDDSRYESLPLYLKIIFLSLTVAGVVLSVFYIFSIRIGGLIINEVAYYYLFLGAFMPCSFLILPARMGQKNIPWYDLLAAVLGFGIYDS